VIIAASLLRITLTINKIAARKKKIRGSLFLKSGFTEKSIFFVYAILVQEGLESSFCYICL
jgi:hypothetical protein